MMTDQWRDEVQALLDSDLFETDNEAAHGETDELIEAFVRTEASAGNVDALFLLGLLNKPRRWYA